MDKIAFKVLGHFGLEAAFYYKENLDREAVSGDLEHLKYPLLLTALNTSGEKAHEESVAENETVTDIGFKSFGDVGYVEPVAGNIEALYEEITNIIAGKLPMDTATTVSKFEKVIPEFHHIEKKKRLDQRM